jgi:arylsulfatase
MALKEYKPGTGSGVSVGRAPGSPITALCGPPFEFAGTILSVTTDISGQLLHDTEEEEKAFARVVMARQ